DAGNDAGVPITGRVCIISDLRHPTTCNDAANASTLTVSIGTTGTLKATPNAHGDFTIIAPLGAFTWHVSGLNFITSVVPFGADTTLPVISDVLYGELLSTNHVTLIDQEGSVVVRVLSGVNPVANVTATSVPVTNSLALYDGNDALLWDSDLNGTGAAG